MSNKVHGLMNTRDYYGSVSIFLHWFMAVLIVFLLMLGFYMVSLPDSALSNQKIILILIHKEIGIGILALVIIRICWRFINQTPQLPDHVPLLQKIAARLTHFTLYVLMVVMPVTGWLMSSAAGLPVTFLGTIVLPDLIYPNLFQIDYYIDLHKWLGYTLLFVLILHTGAAFMHHFFYKDNILLRIMP